MFPAYILGWQEPIKAIDHEFEKIPVYPPLCCGDGWFTEDRMKESKYELKNWKRWKHTVVLLNNTKEQLENKKNDLYIDNCIY